MNSNNAPDNLKLLREDGSESLFEIRDISQLRTELDAICNLSQSRLENEDISNYPEIERFIAVADLPLFKQTATTPCTTAVITVSVDVVSVVFSMLSLGAEVGVVKQYIAQYLISDGLLFAELQAAIPAIASAGNIKEKAMAMYQFAKIMYNSGMLWKAVKKAVSDMPWYEKAYTLAAASATIALWFVTDTTAMIAQFVLVAASSTQLFVDASRAVEACS
mmetsp:Transcript_6955/g.12468  ORF Transcript_6955/g.12468 Transcript_6955/m.12468 type:complete len:220 (-) Transcript_6955:698-1357(-)|eukprot:CAMPEP_0182451428 /NCGR_PEP_ID=MMETSP1172-20130603/43715_1 /TAXON_ID=708627 /ORGANISM="Timspurckia oligopyrenoides, Strain CCMP3278" /LENGTH=219 /DNA_ID=CAMNT_0024649203 /DNA_START=497 /DNA_END=1159 /DNA_ORIENTATION=-